MQQARAHGGEGNRQPLHLAIARGCADKPSHLCADLLAHWFGPAVTEPVRLHVAAKRYLCAVDPAYQAGLSAASILSLVLQGGPMDIEEQARFCAQPHAADAVTLRRWDDAAKDPHCAVPPLDSWRPLLASLLRVSAQP